jgi:integrase
MLTKTLIDAAEPRAARYILWDEDLPGFGLRVFPNGLRSFVVRYRLKGSRASVWLTLGQYGTHLTLTQARKDAERVLRQVRLGDDPQASRKTRAAEAATRASLLTVAKLVERYADALKAGTVNAKRLGRQHASRGYLADTLLHLDRLAAAYGERAADAITRADVLKLLDGYATQPQAHRRMAGAIRRLYDWAQQREMVGNAPADHIHTTAATARERVLTMAEIAAIWRAAGDLDPVYRDLVHLLVATGQRRAEVAGMTWGEIDLAAGLWRLPAGRTKARRQHTVPLPPLAVAALSARRGDFLKEPPADALVLPTLARDGKGIAPVSGWNWLKRELDRRTGIAGWRFHDCRRSLVSHCAEAGADVATLDTLLNHAASATRGGVIGTYQRATLLAPMRAVMVLWDRLLSEALTPRPPAEVVPLLRVAG